MEQSLVKSSNNRLSRNVSEKNRRDRLNSLVKELANVNPYINDTNKRLDKCSILRLTVSYLKLCQYLSRRTKQRQSGQPSSVPRKYQLQDFFMKLDSFIFLINQTGTILFVSDSLSRILGHNTVELIGGSIYSIIHQNDHPILSAELESLKFDQTAKGFSHQKISVTLRLLSLLSESHLSHYECVQFIAQAHFLPNDHLISSLHDKSTNLVFGVARLTWSLSNMELSLKNDEYTEYVSTHALDGRVMNLDKRAAVIIGYLNQELVGTTPYAKCHPDDMIFVLRSHEKLLECGFTNSTVFRLISWDNKQLYINAQSQIIYDKWTNEPKHIMSCNRILQSSVGENLRRKQLVKKEPGVQTGIKVSSDDQKRDERINTLDDKTNVLHCVCIGENCYTLSVPSEVVSDGFYDLEGHHGFFNLADHSECYGSEDHQTMAIDLQSRGVSHNGKYLNSNNPMKLLSDELTTTFNPGTGRYGTCCPVDRYTSPDGAAEPNFECQSKQVGPVYELSSNYGEASGSTCD